MGDRRLILEWGESGECGRAAYPFGRGRGALKAACRVAAAELRRHVTPAPSRAHVEVMVPAPGGPHWSGRQTYYRFAHAIPLEATA